MILSHDSVHCQSLNSTIIQAPESIHRVGQFNRGVGWWTVNAILFLRISGVGKKEYCLSDLKGLQGFRDVQAEVLKTRRRAAA